MAVKCPQKVSAPSTAILNGARYVFSVGQNSRSADCQSAVSQAASLRSVKCDRSARTGDALPKRVTELIEIGNAGDRGEGVRPGTVTQIQTGPGARIAPCG